MSKTAKWVFIIGGLITAYVIFSSVQRENDRKANLEAIHTYFHKKVEIDEKLKKQYDDTFYVTVEKKKYVVTVKDHKVSRVKEQKQ
ncbi:hypothetical protein A374_04494 [Fictibacillus macauensis ZFHKF-1]|uniref:Uncharacterized protein n=1 Tax=Fictibacillus macauensis ZFHKF-1 TaxID=1196324 RepID=I8UIZ7_9BACL|nr:hypothetical protein [Fictibacillus macauensis]EIT86803.1 hypothetical protein A374_04494 [Fictibacillus macauensis ZFHKF-1]